MDKTWKVVLVFAAIFLTGSACGVLIGMRIVRKPLPASTPKTPTPVQTLEQFSRSHISSIAKRLKLTEQQREAIRPSIQKANDELIALRRRGFRETVDILERMNNDIEKVLSPEQFENFTDMRIVQRERMRNLMKGTSAPKAPTDKNQPPAGTAVPAPKK